jgi:hypothetical protein
MGTTPKKGSVALQSPPVREMKKIFVFRSSGIGEKRALARVVERRRQEAFEP